MVTFRAMTFSTMSVSEAYWPSDPMEMPCELKQVMFSMRTSEQEAVNVSTECALSVEKKKETNSCCWA